MSDDEPSMAAVPNSAAAQALQETARPAIESPCVRLCMLHPDTGLCVGCARTGGEIATWSQMTDAERRQIMAILPERQPTPEGRRGGRATRRARPPRLAE